MKKLGVKLQTDEVEKIEYNFERYNSLKELALVFESDKLFSEKSQMYEKILKDMKETKKNMEEWWDKIIYKYKLEEYDQDKLYVDFSAQEIKLLN